MSASEITTLAIASLLLVLGLAALRWRWLVDRAFEPGSRMRFRALQVTGHSRNTLRYQEAVVEIEQARKMLRRRVPYILLGLGIFLIATVFLR